MFLFLYQFTLGFIHPCDEGDNGGCAQTCTKDGDDAICECIEGFEINIDGKTCSGKNPDVVSFRLYNKIKAYTLRCWLVHVYIYIINIYIYGFYITRE